MNYEMLYKLVHQNKGKSLSDIPDELEDTIKGVKGEDLLASMLGMYMKNKLPEGISMGSDSISYSPNRNSTYGLSIKGDTPTINASWRF